MRPLLLAAALPLLAGCLNLAKDYPERHLHALTAARPGEPAGGGKGVLAVRPFTISKRYETPEFVYRKAETEWETDYYNAFVVPPKDMLADAAREWLASSGIYEHVGGLSSSVPPTRILEGHVSELWIDARGGTLKAVVELDVLLADDRESPARILLTRRYRQEEALAKDLPEEAVAAWSRALGRILSDVESDLRESESAR